MGVDNFLRRIDWRGDVGTTQWRKISRGCQRCVGGNLASQKKRATNCHNGVICWQVDTWAHIQPVQNSEFSTNDDSRRLTVGWYPMVVCHYDRFGNGRVSGFGNHRSSSGGSPVGSAVGGRSPLWLWPRRRWQCGKVWAVVHEGAGHGAGYFEIMK